MGWMGWFFAVADVFVCFLFAFFCENYSLKILCEFTDIQESCEHGLEEILLTRLNAASLEGISLNEMHELVRNWVAKINCSKVNSHYQGGIQQGEQWRLVTGTGHAHGRSLITGEITDCPS